MKQILSILIVSLLIVCGGAEKKVKDSKSSNTRTYIYQTPNQDTLANGKTIFEKSCIVCHQDGLDGAAQLTDKDRWIEYRAKDLEILVQHVHDGYAGHYGTMSPKGKCMECSKDDLRDAIFFMMMEAGVLK